MNTDYLNNIFSYSAFYIPISQLPGARSNTSEPLPTGPLSWRGHVYSQTGGRVHVRLPRRPDRTSVWEPHAPSLPDTSISRRILSRD